MDMAPVHNRDARAPAPPAPEAARAPEQPTRRAASNAVSELARVQQMTQELADQFASTGNGFRYEVKRPGSVEIVLYNMADGTVMRRIPLEGESAPPQPRSTREFRA